MNARLVELIRRRERLLLRAEAQRSELSAIVDGWRVPLGVVDRGMAIASSIKSHPALLFAAVVVLAVLRPRELPKWLARGWMMWRFWRSSPLVKWLKHAE